MVGKSLVLGAISCIFLTGCDGFGSGRAYEIARAAVIAHCKSVYPCEIRFEDFSSDWSGLTIFGYTVDTATVSKASGEVPNVSWEFSDRYLVKKTTGETFLEVHTINVEGLRDGELTFSPPPGQDYMVMKRGDRFVVTRGPSPFGGSYYFVEFAAADLGEPKL